MLDPTLPPVALGPALDGARAVLPLELRKLTFIANGKRVIDNLDLTIAERGITVIMGPNGAGKSVLLRLMHGLIVPTSGEIRWAGQRMDRELARRQAMVFQKPVLLRRSGARLRAVLGVAAHLALAALVLEPASGACPQPLSRSAAAPMVATPAIEPRFRVARSGFFNVPPGRKCLALRLMVNECPFPKPRGRNSVFTDASQHCAEAH